jgi:hypothetical protein
MIRIDIAEAVQKYIIEKKDLMDLISVIDDLLYGIDDIKDQINDPRIKEQIETDINQILDRHNIGRKA